MNRLLVRVLAPVCVLALAALILLPRLSGPGLWEPDEMKVADEAARRADRNLGPIASDAQAKAKAHTGPAITTPPKTNPDCPKTAADDDGPRQLTPNLIALDIEWFGSSEGGMRLGLAILALLCVMATYGIGARLGGPRAGLLSALVILSFPLLVMQGRQLTSEIGTATGAALLVYGLVAAAFPVRGPLAVLDYLVAAAAAAAGAILAFLGGGIFLGLAAPIAAVAIAGMFGLRLFADGGRIFAQLGVRLVGFASRPFTVGRRLPFAQVVASHDDDVTSAWISLIALFALIVVAGTFIHQVYDIQNMAPGTREMFGKSFVPRECWADAVGGIWKARDDIKASYDTQFEQAAFGMFPWSVLAPVALGALVLGFAGDGRRYAGRLTLTWAVLAWLCGTIYARKVDYDVYAGFPACAIALGLWLDGVLDHWRNDAKLGTARADSTGLLVGLWALVGMFTLGKDVGAFPDKMATLAFNGNGLKFPPVHWLGLHPQIWAMALAWAIGIAFAAGAWVLAIQAPDPTSLRAQLRRLSPIGLYVAFGLTALLALFWAQAWQPTVSSALSSKDVFSAYRDLHHDGERLGIFGDMGNAPRYYAGSPWDPIRSKEELVTYLSKDERAFALAPANEICAINNAFNGKPYVILDDSNARYMLLSNKVDGGRDHNPLSTMILHDPPTDIGQPFSAVYDDKIELIGFTMPRTTHLGGSFQMTLYFHVLAPVGGAWKIFVHFDGKGVRFQGDHDPINGRCATSYWQKGDYVVDTFTVDAGDLTYDTGNYEARVGFFTGTNPNWKNMNVTKAPPGAKDDVDRVLIGTIGVE